MTSSDMNDDQKTAALNDVHTCPASKGAGGSAGKAVTVTGPTIRRYQLGAELRKLREAAGYLLEDVAARLDVAASTVSRIETGKAPARTSYVQMMLDLYEADDPRLRQYLADLAREGQRKAWWAEYDGLLPGGTGSFLDFEAAAAKISTFAPQTVPVLLQTAGYAQAAIRAAHPGFTAEQAEALTKVTLRRQELSGGRRELHAVIDESALLRIIGSPDVMAAQIDCLATATADPHVTIQVQSMTAPAQILCPGFTVMSLADPAGTEVGCLDEHAGRVTITDDSHSVSDLKDMFATLSRHADSPDDSARKIHEMRRRSYVLLNMLTYWKHPRPVNISTREHRTGDQ
jgi:transcriptional regulator with XRE-family HTH domain